MINYYFPFLNILENRVKIILLEELFNRITDKPAAQNLKLILYKRRE